ncbi:MAG: hypothetical protein NTX11_01305 [Candidatus Saccharibacteria bacterium]|nr:hypothetical protein [Candidatus Saccharibacteria bacterium]
MSEIGNDYFSEAVIFVEDTESRRVLLKVLENPSATTESGLLGIDGEGHPIANLHDYTGSSLTDTAAALLARGIYETVRSDEIILAPESDFDHGPDNRMVNPFKYLRDINAQPQQQQLTTQPQEAAPELPQPVSTKHSAWGRIVTYLAARKSS